MRDHRFDLVSLGEPLLRLVPPLHGQLRRTTSLDVTVAGSQFNLAANLARLGRRTMLLTRVPDSPLGQLVIDAARTCGVDTSQIQLRAGGRLGIVYVEFSADPRRPLAVYDRAGSAAAGVGPADFDWRAIARESAAFFTDGIFAGLSPTCRQAAAAALRAARECDCLTCFDVNYREHLWTPETARQALVELLPLVDVLVTNRDVAERVLGFRGTNEQLLAQHIDEFGCRCVCLTERRWLAGNRGALTSLALSEGRSYAGREIEFDVIDRYGSGDAWFAGFLHVWLERRPIDAALDFATASAALAHTIVGDVTHIDAADVEAVLRGDVARTARR